MDTHYAGVSGRLNLDSSMALGDSEAPSADESIASESKRLKLKIRKFYAGRIFLANHGPFSKYWVYDESLLMRTSAQSTPIDLSHVKNLTISFDNRGGKSDVTAFMVSGVSMGNFFGRGRLLPLTAQGTTTVKSRKGVGRRDADNKMPNVVVDGITDHALAQFQAQYQCLDLNKEDIFYYVYGVLHSEDCRSLHMNDLRRERPRIPMVQRLVDFRAFSEGGRLLAQLHVNYDAVVEYPVSVDRRERPDHVSEADYWYVTEMVFGSRGNRTKIIYNEWISVSGIPHEAYKYVIYGKPAVVWAMMGQGVSVHAASGVINDANCWAIEVMADPAYPLKLLQRVITVALETRKIVNAFPFLDVA
jgi:hypothetical protein